MRNFFFAAAGECYIDLRSTGCNDGAFRGCHVRANWTNVHHAEPAGIYLALVDPVTCKGTPFPVVNPSDAGAAAAVTLSMYINLLTFGQVVVGATCNDCYRNLSPATPALESIGVQGLNRLNLCGKLAFVAQKGSPRKTLSVVKQAAEGNSWLVVKVIVGKHIFQARCRNLRSIHTASGAARLHPVSDTQNDQNIFRLCGMLRPFRRMMARSHSALPGARYRRGPVAVDRAVSGYMRQKPNTCYLTVVSTLCATARAAALEVETCSTLRAVERGQT
jgi:hypothetical protein